MIEARIISIRPATMDGLSFVASISSAAYVPAYHAAAHPSRLGETLLEMTRTV
jgi:hypothetical protein